MKTVVRLRDLDANVRQAVLALIEAGKAGEGSPAMAMIAEPVVNNTEAEELLSARRWEFRLVRVASIKWDRRYHDPARFNERRAAAMAAEFDEERARTVEVSERADGSLWGLDGQHRSAAAKSAGVTYLPARVFHDLSVDEESTLYRAFNASVALTFKAKWQARVFEGEPVAAAILAVGEETGVPIQSHARGGARVLKAVALAEIIHRAGLLKPTLLMAQDSWPDDHDAFGTVTLRAIASMLFVYRGHPRFSRERLARQLGAVRVVELAKRAHAMSEALTSHQGGTGGIGGWTVERRAALHYYNKNLRTPLPDVGMSEIKRLQLGQDIWAE